MKQDEYYIYLHTRFPPNFPQRLHIRFPPSYMSSKTRGPGSVQVSHRVLAFVIQPTKIAINSTPKTKVFEGHLQNAFSFLQDVEPYRQL
jgi:hypothetical protein